MSSAEKKERKIKYTLVVYDEEEDEEIIIVEYSQEETADHIAELFNKLDAEYQNKCLNEIYRKMK